jgi:hypothetical protein
VKKDIMYKPGKNRYPLSTLLLLAAIMPWFQSGFAGNEYPARQHEQIYLHLDRFLYVTGDRLWYKAYVIDPVSWDFSSESKVLYIELINSANEKVSRQILRLTDGQAHGDIFIPDTLDSGVYTLVAYTNWMRNTGPASFSGKHILIYNRFENPDARVEPEESVQAKPDPFVPDTIFTKQPESNDRIAKVLINSNKMEYMTREKVVLDIKVSVNNLLSPSHYSVSVAKVPPVPFYMDNPMLSKLVSCSDIRTARMDTGQYFPKEVKGILVQGMLVWKHNHLPAAGLKLLLAIPDSVPVFDYCLTDTLGRFSFVLDKDYTSKLLYLLPAGNKRIADSLMIRWDEKFSDRAFFSDQVFEFPSLDPEFLLSQRKRIAIQHVYEINRNISADKRITPVQTNGHPFYGIPSFTVYPEEYMPLPNFKEIARELLPLVRFTGQPGNYSLHIHNPETNYPMRQSFVLLDGIPVYDLNLISGLGSSDLEKIEIQNISRIYGDFILNGMVALYTKDKRIHSMDLTKSHLVYEFPKFYNPGIHTQPVYDTEEQKNERIPDFRDLLYWQPENIAGPDGKARLEFYTSDETGKYRITVEGVTMEGIPFSSTLDLNVTRIE